MDLDRSEMAKVDSARPRNLDSSYGHQSISELIVVFLDLYTKNDNDMN